MYEERMSRKRIYNYALAPIIQVQPDRESYQIGNEMLELAIEQQRFQEFQMTKEEEMKGVKQ